MSRSSWISLPFYLGVKARPPALPPADRGSPSFRPSPGAGPRPINHWSSTEVQVDLERQRGCGVCVLLGSSPFRLPLQSAEEERCCILRGMAGVGVGSGQVLPPPHLLECVKPRTASSNIGEMKK